MENNTRTPTVIDYDAVISHIKAVARQENLKVDNNQDLSKALTMFALQGRFGEISSYDLDLAITDGANDQGIDAVHIEEEGDAAIINVLQTKLNLSRERINEKRFPGNEVDKFISKFQEFILEYKHTEHSNSKLQQRINDVKSADNKEYRLTLVTTGLPPAKEAIERANRKVKEYNSQGRKYVSLEVIDLAALHAMLPMVKESNLDFSIQLDGNVVETRAGKTSVTVGKVNGRTIAKLVKDNREDLFEKNVRGYLKNKNQVNKKIYKSATEELEAPYFFVLNNGITIVCEDYQYMGGVGSPKIDLESAQIVNGGQTSYSLYEASKKNLLQSSVEVLIRIIKTNDRGVLSKITEATNSQTAVRSRDLHSNDPIQKSIKEKIKNEFGLYYESRKNEFQAKIPNKKRIDAEVAAQAYYAYHDGEPADAKTGKSKLFDRLYEHIFNDEIDISKLVLSFLALSGLKELNNEKDFKNFNFRRDALLTSLALLKDFSDIKSVRAFYQDQKDDHRTIRKDYMKIIEATDVIIKEEIRRIGEAGFEKRRFFISPSTMGRIQEVLIRSNQ